MACPCGPSPCLPPAVVPSPSLRAEGSMAVVMGRLRPCQQLSRSWTLCLCSVARGAAGRVVRLPSVRAPLLLGAVGMVAVLSSLLPFGLQALWENTPGASALVPPSPGVTWLCQADLTHRVRGTFTAHAVGEASVPLVCEEQRPGLEEGPTCTEQPPAWAGPKAPGTGGLSGHPTQLGSVCIQQLLGLRGLQSVGTHAFAGCTLLTGLGSAWPRACLGSPEWTGGWVQVSRAKCHPSGKRPCLS